MPLIFDLGGIKIEDTWYVRGWLTKMTCKRFNISIIRVIQVVPVHPGLHPKQYPFCMWQTLSLQLVGHRSLQLFPYTPECWQPKAYFIFKLIAALGFWHLISTVHPTIVWTCNCTVCSVLIIAAFPVWPIIQKTWC